MIRLRAASITPCWRGRVVMATAGCPRRDCSAGWKNLRQRRAAQVWGRLRRAAHLSGTMEGQGVDPERPLVMKLARRAPRWGPDPLAG